MSQGHLVSKDNLTGHSERKTKKRQTEEESGRQYQKVDRTESANSSTRTAEKMTLWNGIVANSYLVPRPPKVMG